jgi:hypothetical protein
VVWIWAVEDDGEFEFEFELELGVGGFGGEGFEGREVEFGAEAGFGAGADCGFDGLDGFAEGGVCLGECFFAGFGAGVADGDCDLLAMGLEALELFLACFVLFDLVEEAAGEGSTLFLFFGFEVFDGQCHDAEVQVVDEFLDRRKLFEVAFRGMFAGGAAGVGAGVGADGTGAGVGFAGQC